MTFSRQNISNLLKHIIRKSFEICSGMYIRNFNEINKSSIEIWPKVYATNLGKRASEKAYEYFARKKRMNITLPTVCQLFPNLNTLLIDDRISNIINPFTLTENMRSI